MMQPTIPNLKTNLGILDQADDAGWRFAIQIGEDLDQGLPHRATVLRFAGNLMQREGSFHLEAFGRLVHIDDERNAERLQSQGHLARDLAITPLKVRIDQSQQATQSEVQLLLLEDLD